METYITKKLATEITPAQFEEAMERYAAAGLRGLEINKAIEAEVNEILEKYEHDLQFASQSKNAAFETMRAYCTLNKDKLFGKRRSIGTPHGTAGFRLGTPRLKTAPGHNWKTIMKKLREKLPAYVRITEEPAKDLLLADRHKDSVAPMLLEIGVQVVQDELFYIEPRQQAA